MPSGITSRIHEEENVSFAEFVWHCARHFGPFIHLRDYPSSFNITDLKLPTESIDERRKEYKEKLDKYAKELIELMVISDEDLMDNHVSHCVDNINKYQEWIDKAEKLKIKLDKIRKEVEDWNTPETHKELKIFMLKMIDQDIKNDCATSYYQECIDDLDRSAAQDAKTVRKLSKESIDRMIAFYSEKLRELNEIDINENQKWVDDLDAMVPNPWVKR